MSKVVDEANGLLGSDNTRTGYVRGVEGADKFRIREITYSEVDGEAIFEGCIIVGSTNQMAELKQEVEDAPFTVDELNAAQSLGISVLSHSLWPKGRLVYRIDDNLGGQDRVRDAIAHWEEHTDIEFVERTDEQDFVSFVPGGGCSAHVGRIGGEQFVRLGPGCSTGNTIHEIGHALGLWHEQSRSDRDDHIEVLLENVIESAIHNFNQHIHDGQDLAEYDTASIMHYGTHFFSKNGEPTIRSKDGSPLGQRAALSDGDIAAIAEAYENEFAKRANE